MKRVLSIASSSNCGRIGIQADLKTIFEHRLCATSAITEVIARNGEEVVARHQVPAYFLEKQLESIFEENGPNAIKIGELSSEAHINVITRILEKYNPNFIVLDAVRAYSNKKTLLDDSAMKSLINELIPYATIITPNITEAEILSGMSILSKGDMVRVAEKLDNMFNGVILIKGGHKSGSNDDLIYNNGTECWFDCKRIECADIRGRGDMFSSAIACNLALGYDMPESVANAKEYITEYIKCEAGEGEVRYKRHMK